MIACIEQKDPPRLCPLRWVGKTGFASVGVLTYCGTEASIANGVVQVPDNILTGGTATGITLRGLALKCCERCKALLEPKP